jgi:cation transport regulator ChaC
MTGRQTTPRQDPLPPEVGFGELMTRMISANRVEKAKRARADGVGRTPAQETSDPRGTPQSPGV